MNASSNSDTPPPCRTAPIALWRVAEAFMHILFALFGGPEDVARRHTLRLEAHQLMASWLRCAEAMMRRLLLIEAAAHAKPNTRPLLHAPRKRVRKLVGFTPEHPEEWRVSFHSMGRGHPRPRVLKAVPPAKAPALRKRISREDRWNYENFKPVKFRSAWPLAERYEALLRVFNNPTAYAHRLSRRLHATPHRVLELLRAPPEAEHRVDIFDALTTAAVSSAAAFNSS